MAITPLVEKAILNGWGTLRNFSVGASGFVKIKIPKNHFGIITDFIYHPYHFVFSNSDAVLLPDLDADTFQEVCFYSSGKSYKWTFKNSWSICNNAGTIGHTYFPMESFKVDTMVMVEDDIFIQFKSPQLLNGGFVGDFSPLPKNQAPASPETVGTSDNTVRRLDVLSGDIYYFPGYEENNVNPSNKTLTTVNSQSSSEFYNAVIGSPTNNYQLPLLNIQVLMVAEQNRNFLNQRD